MTTFQDPQPQSRRAVRQNERGDAPEPGAGFAQFPPQAPFPAPAPQYVDPDSQRDMWDTNARRAAQLPTTPAPRPDAAVTGRRAAPAASQPPAAAEPLTYSTASRQQPSDQQSFRSRLDARQAAAQSLQSQVPGDASSYRVRDFSPEGRRADRGATPPAAAAEVPAAPFVPPTDLDYQTEVREGFGMPQAPVQPPAPISQVPPQLVTHAPITEAPVAQVPVTQQPAAPQPVAPPQSTALPASFGAPTPLPVAQPIPYADAPGEQTLSRRELRALLAEQESAALGTQGTHNEPVAWQPPVPSQPDLAQSFTQQPFAQEPQLTTQQPQQHFTAQPIAPQVVQQVPPQLVSPVEAPQAYEATRMPELGHPVAPPQPSTNTAMTSALAEFDSLTTAAPAVQEEPAGWRPPVGHWSTQGDIDEEELPETTINRRVGSGSTATNALVLPEIPLGSDIRGPLTSTGEVMLTGSIDLPRSLGSTGTSARIDHDGIDGLFDLTDHEVISTDSQPVRAIKAVSTHQTGHGVTHTQKPKGTRALTVLLISASSMAVIVAGLLVAAFAFNIF